MVEILQRLLERGPEADQGIESTLRVLRELHDRFPALPDREPCHRVYYRSAEKLRGADEEHVPETHRGDLSRRRQSPRHHHEAGLVRMA